jgi:hypothetical protein
VISFPYQALLEARKPRSIHKALVDATIAVFFFGTPHQGLRIEELRGMAMDLIPDSDDTVDLLQKLRAGSDFLEMQSEELVELLETKKVVSFYETLRTQAVRMVIVLLSTNKYLLILLRTRIPVDMKDLES